MLLKLKKDLKTKRLFIPKETILNIDNWLYIIGRVGTIDINNSSDSEWWEEIDSINHDTQK